MITTDHYFSLAKRLSNDTLHTLTHRKPFKVDVDGNYIVYTPLGSGKPRRQTRKYIDKLIDEFKRTGATNPGHYTTMTANSAYFVALLDRLINPPIA